MVMAARSHSIWVLKEEGKEKQKGKAKGKGPRYRDRTISGHDLPHTEVRDSRVALNSAKKGSDGFRKGWLGSFLEGSLIPYAILKKKKKR